MYVRHDAAYLVYWYWGWVRRISRHHKIPARRIGVGINENEHVCLIVEARQPVEIRVYSIWTVISTSQFSGCYAQLDMMMRFNCVIKEEFLTLLGTQLNCSFSVRRTMSEAYSRPNPLHERKKPNRGNLLRLVNSCLTAYPRILYYGHWRWICESPRTTGQTYRNRQTAYTMTFWTPKSFGIHCRAIGDIIWRRVDTTTFSFEFPHANQNIATCFRTTPYVCPNVLTVHAMLWRRSLFILDNHCLRTYQDGLLHITHLAVTWKICFNIHFCLVVSISHDRS